MKFSWPNTYFMIYSWADDKGGESNNKIYTRLQLAK